MSTVSRFLDSFLATHLELAPSTLTGYRTAVDWAKRLVGDVQVRDITVAHFRTMFANMAAETSPGFRRLVRTQIAIAFDQAVSDGLLAQNPVRLVKAPRRRKATPATWNEEQLRLFWTAASSLPREHALFYVLVATGGRVGEVLALTWGDVDLGRGSIRISKTLREVTAKGQVAASPKTSAGVRTVAIGPRTVQVLRDFYPPGASPMDLVFRARTGKPLWKAHVRKAFKALTVAAGLPEIRVHDLRHTSATLLLEQGVNPKVVAERLGHESPKVTLETYSHVKPKMDHEAAMKLEAVL